MSCVNCESGRIINIYGKCSDLFSASMGRNEYNGYVLRNIGIGGG
jgi:hypothetical protein